MFLLILFSSLEKRYSFDSSLNKWWVDSLNDRFIL